MTGSPSGIEPLVVEFSTPAGIDRYRRLLDDEIDAPSTRPGRRVAEFGRGIVDRCDQPPVVGDGTLVGSYPDAATRVRAESNPEHGKEPPDER